MLGGKRGLSAVVATISLVLLTFIAVAIISNFVVPFVRDNIREGTECFNYREYFKFEEEFGFNCYNTSSSQYFISVRALSGNKEIEEKINGFKISFVKGGNAQIIEINKGATVGGGIAMLDGSSIIKLPKGGEVITYLYSTEENYEVMEIYPLLDSGKLCDKSDDIDIEGEICG